LCTLPLRLEVGPDSQATLNDDGELDLSDPILPFPSIAMRWEGKAMQRSQNRFPRFNVTQGPDRTGVQ
jgi:hypothetical protein